MLPKVIGTPNLVCKLVFTKFFSKKLILSSWRHHSDVKAIFSKSDVIFAMMTQAFQILYKAQPIWHFQADMDIDNWYLNLLTTKFCRYFSINLTLKASLLVIPLQRKATANTSHPPVLFNKKTNQKYDLAINSQVRFLLALKSTQFKVIVLSRYLIGGR